MRTMNITRKYDPQPGDIGLTRIGGFTGVLVGLGQFIIRDASRYTHVFVVLDSGELIEAMPGGAKIESLQKYAGKTKHGSQKAVYVDLGLTTEQRIRIVDEARKLAGTPYSFLDYLALALDRFGFKSARLEKYIADTGHMICSQLAVEVVERAGVDIFGEEISQKITPGDWTYLGYER